MTIVYSCVASGSTILCSHQIGAGTFEKITESFLPNVSTRNDGKTTYTAENYSYHCLVDNGIIYICTADPTSGKRQPYAYLSEIKKKFQTGTFAARAFQAREHEFDGDFGFIMSTEMERFSKPEGNDSLSVLRSQVDDVKGVMTQNIEKVLQRGERLEDLMDKTEELEASSATFQKTARRIRKKYWWKNTKMKIILAIVILVILIVIILIILYATGALDSSGSGGKTSPKP